MEKIADACCRVYRSKNSQTYPVRNKMLKNIHIWLPSYIKRTLKLKSGLAAGRPTQIMFCIADHFEPRWRNASKEKEIERVEIWLRKYMPIANRHRDSEGNIPKYTFFYPIDEYTPEAFEKIAQFCEKGFGEIEIQLHHDNDTAESLLKKLENAKFIFSKRGLLSRDKVTREIRYGFIHGNWALDNSRKDGRRCGVNNELEVLRDTGCYADFTLPSAPSDTQTAKINSIYYAKDTLKPKSHNKGIDVEVGRGPSGDLMIIQGPLTLNWKRRKIENSGISSDNPPTKERIDLWINERIGVKGRPDWIFVKIYAHGAQDVNLTDSYFKNLDNMFAYLEEKYDDKVNYKLHYVTAREMYNIVKAAEAGKTGNPDTYREYILVRGQNVKR